MNKQDRKKLQNKTRRDFLHTFFPSSTGYQEIEINGFHLINQFNSTTQEWDVAIFSKESFQKRKEFLLKTKQENNLFGE